METSRSSIVPIIVALSVFFRMETCAQGDQKTLQFGTMLRPPRATVSGTAKTQERHDAERHNLQVQGNFARHREEVARLTAGGTREAVLQGALHSPLVLVGTGSISGVVYQSDGVTPAEYAMVEAFNEFGVYCGNVGIYSYSGGAYQIQSLPAGSYYVQLTVIIGQFTEQYYNGVTDWRQATLVNVVDAVETKGINFVLKQHLGAVAGRVCATDGTPLTECSVDVCDLSQNVVNYGSVDLAGNFFVSGLPTGDFKIQVATWGDENYLSQWYGGATTFEKASIVHVVEPGTTGAVNFFLAKGGVIGGIVTAQGGDSVATNACYIYAVDGDGNDAGYAQNGTGGMFFIPRLATGSYSLSYEYFGPGNYTSGWYDMSPDASHATPVHVSAPDTVSVTIALQRGGAIAGMVSYYVPGGIDVIAYNEQGTQVQSAVSDQDGQFTIVQLPAGRYRILASTLKSYYFYADQAIDQWYGNAQDFSHAKFVDVHASDTTRGIAFTLQQGGSIMGGVFNANGIPLTSGGSFIVCDVRGAQIRSVALNNAGTYQIGGLPSGEYKLYFEYSGQESYASEWYYGQPSYQTATAVSVTAPTVTGNVNFFLKQAATLSGYLTDNSGARLSSDDHQLDVMLYAGDAGNYAGGHNLSFNGGFQANLLPGKYKVGFFNISWNTSPVQDSLAVVYYDHGKSFADTAAKSVTLVPGAAVRLNDSRMERTGGGIAGTVFDRGTGRPMSRGTFVILAFDEQGRPVAASGYTSSAWPLSGAYRIAGLRPGKFYLLALAGSPNSNYTLTQWYDNIDVPPDSVMNVPFPTVPSGTVAVTVGQGTTSGVDFHLSLTTAIPSACSPASPQAYLLDQNYPNPFNPTTTIRYQIPAAGHVTLEVFDLLGRDVTTLENGERQAGGHTVTFNASGLASGVYFYRLRAGNFVQTKKLLILR